MVRDLMGEEKFQSERLSSEDRGQLQRRFSAYSGGSRCEVRSGSAKVRWERERAGLTGQRESRGAGGLPLRGRARGHSMTGPLICSEAGETSNLPFLADQNDQILSISCGSTEYFASLSFDFFSAEMLRPVVLVLRLEVMCVCVRGPGPRLASGDT